MTSPEGSQENIIPLINIHWDDVQVPLLACTVIMVAGFSKIIFYKINKYFKSLPECVLLIIIGCIIGEFHYAIYGKEIAEHLFTPTIFFTYFLPPIMLEAGYFLPKKDFLENIGTILTFAVFGTIFNAIMIGFTLYAAFSLGWMPGLDNEEGDLGAREFLLFGSIMSAVDPVTVIAVFNEIHVHAVLYITVFGESILNDGVAVVLFEVFESFLGLDELHLELNLVRVFLKFAIVAGGGTILGFIYGFVASYTFKFTNKLRIVEPLLVVVFCYTSYLLAELLGLSAILSIIFCSFTLKQRIKTEVDENTQIVTEALLRMLANIAEHVIFIFLGITVVEEFLVDFQAHWNTGLFFFTLFSVLVFRFIATYGLTFVLNYFRKNKICYNDQIMIAMSGLRGGIAFSLTKMLTHTAEIPHIHKFLSTCIAIIMFTSIIQGGAIQYLVKFLKIKTAADEEIELRQNRMSTRSYRKSHHPSMAPFSSEEDEILTQRKIHHRSSGRTPSLSPFAENEEV